ncbi:MAG: cytidyltransferase [Candidatus Aminicenantes bacterium]|nr:cytidyltransferase [Candidatus Aminicenantes bacterium]
MKTIAMIPARMGSKRLKQKNLQKIGGVGLLARTIQKTKQAGVFDEIWVNSEHPTFEELALKEGVYFHKRPEELAGDQATSEQFTYEFLTHHPCDYIVQVHTIAPLLRPETIVDFVKMIQAGQFDVLLSVVNEQIECIFNGVPINFSFSQKTNSQELIPVQRITWSITGWHRQSYMNTYETGKCATYSGRIGFFILDRLSGNIIKTKEDLEMAEVFFRKRFSDGEKN